MANNCPGLPIPEYSNPICPGKWACPDGSNCKSMTYILAEHYVKQGHLLPGASGAYVPAMTMCFANINPIKISNLKNSNNKTVSLPQPPNFA